MKKLISLLLAVLMIVTAIPVFSFAEDETSMKDIVASKSVGDTIEFGSYPQAEVTDANFIEALNNISADWISYGYYISGTQSDYMKYKDVIYNGEKYRAVTFSLYRPYSTTTSSSTSNSYQDNNGYTTGNVYWFKYEPLTWKVLDPSTGLVLCENIIDSQAFNDTYYKDTSSSTTTYYTDSTKEYYANNYEQSTIRTWLNNIFYNTAFTADQQSAIATTTINNAASLSKYNAKATSDKIYLLSYADILNTSYGFSSSDGYDINRRAHASDYAKSQGIYVATSYTDSDVEYTSQYRCRSFGNDSFSTTGVNYDGIVYGSWDTDITYGVRPALCFNLQSKTNQSTAEDETEKFYITDYSVGDTLEFGSYPQTEVSDEDLIESLNNISADWISYGYYIEGEQSDFMKYKDVTYNGNKYRAVTFLSYRPYYTTNSSSTDYSYQDDNGYTTGNVYWFKYGPLAWKVLDPSTGLVLCTNIIDSQDYYPSMSRRTINGKTVYPNNWEYSTIRTWLNDTFYNTAFTADQQSAIATTTINNDAYSTSYSQYNANATSDKIYLLSYADMLNTSYGFSSNYSTHDINRSAHASDYAKSQGVEVNKNYRDSDAEYISYYRCRSAGGSSDSTTEVIAGYVYGSYGTCRANDGICPALSFNLQSKINQTSSADDEKTMKDLLASKSVGDTVEFGSYPQTEVTDEDLIEALNNISADWISYGYYIESEQSDFMKYKDVTYNGEKYRAVTFSSYRPFYTTFSSSADRSYQDDNGYTISNVYWFKYEPLTWKVLDPSTGLVLCENIIDSQDYYYSTSDRTIDGTTVYPYNWEYSTIRNWLNETFYNTAFDSSEKSQIPCTKLITLDYSNEFSEYDVGETEDYIFLPSYLDMQNTSYGFSNDINCRAHASDYAKSQGICVDTSYTDSDGEYTSSYRCRSDGYFSECTTEVIYSSGSCMDFWTPVDTARGIRPALCFNPSSSATCNGVGHTWDDGVVTTYATCTTDGVKTYTCTGCGDTKIEVIPANGHTPSDEWTVIYEATCTDTGFQVKYCKNCDTTEIQEDEVIPALGHDLIVKEVVAATCMSSGYTVYECSRSGCDYTYVSDFVPVTGHKVVIDKAVAATCTTAGKTEGSHCSVCGEIIKAQEEIPAGGHVLDNGKITRKPTCVTTGTKTYSCTTCGKVIKTETLGIIAHNPGTGIVAKEPTCSEEGTITYRCTVCGNIAKTESIAKLGHTEIEIPAVSATCKSTGLTAGKKCSICGEITEAQQTVARLPHTDANNDGICDDCATNIQAEKEANCTHICHSTSKLLQFFWKIFNFFNKLFKINKYCDCGAAHY